MRRLWRTITNDARVVPCGLGARDSLRLEMGMALYGNDIDDTVTPLEANLGWIVKLQKGDFVGRDALLQLKAQGITKRLVAFTSSERAFPRHGYPVYHQGAPSGVVCSGTLSPTLGIPIGTCYLPVGAAKDGEGFEIDIRGKRVACTVTKTPFYPRKSLVAGETMLSRRAVVSVTGMSPTGSRRIASRRRQCAAGAWRCA
ncbi:MAG: glycine cleavage T C-terminal barrel domain-containing protein [Gemmatimonadaceae bacterium]